MLFTIHCLFDSFCYLVIYFTEDWSYVFKPPIICKMVGSSKYAPLTNLPSQNLPAVSVPPNCVYKPSWVQHAEKPHPPPPPPGTQNPPHQQPPHTNPLPPNTIHQNPFPPSPLHAAFRQPPPPYELPSPATSTASSYLNKNLNSVEATPSIQRTPEASSLALNILLTDTASNIFRDHNFDSCTLCVCNAGGRVVGNIRGADAGVYLISGDRVQQPSSPFGGCGGMGQPPPYGGMLSPSPLHHHNHQQMFVEEDGIRCSCGFSAVVNRRLAYGSGLFYEDEMEITGEWFVCERSVLVSKKYRMIE